MLLEMKNGRFWLADFEVYYKAAQRIMNGITLYRHTEDLHYVFKYSPVSAILFIPFTLFSFSLAKIFYWLVLTGIILYSFFISVRLIQTNSISNITKVNIVILVSIPILALHFLRELHLGQVNVLLLAIFLAMIYYYKINYKLSSALLFSIGIFFKPFALIFIPYLIVKKEWRTLLYTVIFVSIISFTPFFFTFSWDHFLHEYLAWFKEISLEMNAKQDILAKGNLTLFSFIARYTPILFLIRNGFNVFIYQISILFITCIFYLYLFIKGKDIKNSEVLDFSILLCTIPLLAYTSANAFIFVQLGVVIIVYFWKSLRFFEKIVGIISFSLIGGNFGELLGDKLSTVLDNLSLITLGTVLLVYLLASLRVRKII